MNGNGPAADLDSLEQRVLSMIGGRTTELPGDDAVNAGGRTGLQPKPIDR